MFKRCVRYLNQLKNRVYVALIPTEKRWVNAQKRYVSWAKNPLDAKYLEHICHTGDEFSSFLGEPTRLIDVGCGNGLYGGMRYEAAGYIPIKRGSGYVLGIDPLPLILPIPWLSEFKQGKIENMKLSGFTEASFVTTFDHIAYPNSALKSLKDAGVKRIFLWETLYLKPTGGDQDHPHHYTMAQLEEVFRLWGYAFTRRQRVNAGRDAEEWFIEANLR